MNAMILAKATNILKNAGCTEIYLFGSQATGKANDNSDVDLGGKRFASKALFPHAFRFGRSLKNAGRFS